MWPEKFIDFVMWKMDPMSGCDIRLVFTLQPRDRTLQHKQCVHLWNNYLYVIILWINSLINQLINKFIVKLLNCVTLKLERTELWHKFRIFSPYIV